MAEMEPWRKAESGYWIMEEPHLRQHGESFGSQYLEYTIGPELTRYHQNFGYFHITCRFTQVECLAIAEWCICPCLTFMVGGSLAQ